MWNVSPELLYRSVYILHKNYEIFVDILETFLNIAIINGLRKD